MTDQLSTHSPVVGKKQKVMEFITVLFSAKRTINLDQFYRIPDRKQRLSACSDFQKILADATHGYETVEIDERFFLYQNMDRVADSDAMTEVKESVYDFGTEKGCLEFCKRLGWLAFFLKMQPKGEPGKLPNDGSCIIIGWVKLKNGTILVASACWRSGTSDWWLVGDDLSEWGAHHYFLSRYKRDAR